MLDVAYLGVHGVDTVANYNLNNPFSTLGGGTASEPLNILYGKTASATLCWEGYSSSYNALQVKLDRRFGSLVMTTAFTWGKAMNYQNDDDGNLIWLINQRRNYARTDFDRTLYLRAELRLPVAVGRRTEVDEQRAGSDGAGELAALRRADAADGNADSTSPPAAAA